MKPIWETEDMRATTSWQPKKNTQAAWPPTFDGDDQTTPGSPKLIFIITIVTTAAILITTIYISRITTSAVTLICYGIGGDELVFSQKERRKSSNVIPKMKDKYDERLLDRGLGLYIF